MSKYENFFERTTDSKVRCRLCYDNDKIKEYTIRKGGPTTNLKHHLEFVHPNVFVGGELVDLFTSSIITHYVNHSLPISQVDSQSFRNMIKEARKTTAPPVNSKNLKYCISVQSRNLMNRIKEHLYQVDKVSTSCDHWTSIGGHNYLSVTVHWRDRNMSSQWAVICFQKDSGHTEELASSEIYEVFKEFGIEQKMLCIVGDGTNSMVATLRNLANRCNCYYHVCFSHVFQKAISKSFESIDDIDVAIKKAKSIVGFISSSPKFLAFLESSRNDDVYGHKPVNSNSTRWDSVFLMIQSFRDQYDIINRCLKEYSKTNASSKPPKPLSETDIEILESIFPTLVLLRSISLQLQDRDTGHIGVVIPTYQILSKITLECTEVDQLYLQKFGEKLWYEFSSRVSKYYLVNGKWKELYIIGAMCSPSSMWSIKKHPDFETHFQGVFESRFSDVESPSISIDSEEPTRKIRMLSKAALFSLSRNGNHIERINQETGYQLESVRYLESEYGPEITASGWWKYETKFPKTKKIAIAFLSCPCSSSEPERTFSHSGLIITKKRVRLSDKSVRDLLFLKLSSLYKFD